MTDPIRLETYGDIAELILDQPARRNALSVAMWAGLPRLVAGANDDTSVKVIILRGAGGHFAAGADISEFDAAYSDREAARASGGHVAAALAALETSAKPVIAAIDGSCVGGGVSLALACDIRIASEAARFAITPARLGIVYPPSDTRRLLQAVGPGQAKRLLMTAGQIGAEEARKIGLVDLISDGDIHAAARELAGEIAANSQWSVRNIKAMIAGLQSGWSDASPEAEDLFLDGWEGDDFAEGRAAFLAKRKADFPVR